MNLEGRNASGQYYYTSRRIDGRVVKEYVGRAADPIVQVFAQAFELASAEATAVVAEVRAEQASYEELMPTLDRLEEAVSERINLTLVACGFRRRKGKLQAVKYRKTTMHNNYSHRELTREFVEHLAHRANRGDQAAASKLREVLRENPAIMEHIGNLSAHAECSVIKMIASGNMLLEESLRFEANKLRESLRSESADGALVGFLVDHAVLCWLELYFVRTAAMQPQHHKQDTRFWDQRLQKATARFQTAVKELATLRQLIERPADVVPLVKTHQNESGDKPGIII